LKRARSYYTRVADHEEAAMLAQVSLSLSSLFFLDVTRTPPSTDERSISKSGHSLRLNIFIIGMITLPKP
jgi:hypothetical protein